MIVKVRQKDGTLDYLDTTAFMFSLKRDGHLRAVPLNEVRKIVYEPDIAKPLIAVLDGAVGGSKIKRAEREKILDSSA